MKRRSLPFLVMIFHSRKILIVLPKPTMWLEMSDIAALNQEDNRLKYSLLGPDRWFAFLTSAVGDVSTRCSPSPPESHETPTVTAFLRVKISGNEVTTKIKCNQLLWLKQERMRHMCDPKCSSKSGYYQLYYGISMSLQLEVWGSYQIWQQNMLLTNGKQWICKSFTLFEMIIALPMSELKNSKLLASFASTRSLHYLTD